MGRSACRVLITGTATLLSLVSVNVGISQAVATTDRFPPESTLELSLDEALGLFLRQNFDVLISKFGIEDAKGAQITARLFPNPVISVGFITSSAKRLQGEPSNVQRSGQFYPQVQQLFELAGKRGYRIESAGYGVQSAEASFEDTLRQLGFTVKDTYYQVQLAQRRLALAEENRDRFARILSINRIRFEKGFIAEVDLIRLRLQVIDFHSQVIEALQASESAKGELRMLLGVSAATLLTLTTDLTYHYADPPIESLRLLAIESRPDLRMKRFIEQQRMADLRLAKAYRYPDVTVGGGYAIQGALGPDNPQQWAFNVGIPLLLFNRNQGGIRQAEVGLQTAEADAAKSHLQIENEVEVAYLNLVQSRRLVEAYRAGVLDQARETLSIIERAYERGGATILDLLDAARSSRAIQQNYLEALFIYQRNLLQLESAVGREIS